MTDTVSLKVRVQKLGTALSNMVMPNIPVLQAADELSGACAPTMTAATASPWTMGTFAPAPS